VEVQSLHEQVLQAEREFSVVLADTPKLRGEAFRLRYQVYCLERGFERGYDGLETDEFDIHAGHVLLIHQDTSETIGTVRIIPSWATGGVQGLPMATVCAPGLLQHLPPLATGEVSRFAVSKVRRVSCRVGALLRLGLFQGVARLSRDLGLTHGCAIMEPALIRLLQIHSIRCAPLGPPVEYHGLRQPTHIDLAAIAYRARTEHWDIWNYCTRGGALLSGSAPEPVAA
jgi:N-acyl-L-homoserine lactone synthetase